jgi:hypothetical protein
MDHVISPTDWPKYLSPLEIGSLAHSSLRQTLFKNLMLQQHVELVYDTSPGTTTRVARGGSLIGETNALDTQTG